VLRFILRRLALIPIQAIGVTLVTFLLVRLLPGNPAQRLAGPFAGPQAVKAESDRLGLGQPLWTQYWKYLDQVVHLQLGTSFTTGQPVSQEIFDRLPATLELITVALVISVVLGIGLGAFIALRQGSLLDKLTFGYGLLAGALPDFWIGLLLVYLFFYKLGWAPAPTGQMGIGYACPRHTGFLLIDCVIAGQWGAWWSAITHLILPVATLVFVYMGAILKMTRSRLSEVLDADYVRYAERLGITRLQTFRYALRNALPAVVTISAVTYSFLLGGAVLVETIFSWGGLGQYAVQAVQGSDYPALQGVILIAAIFNLIVYLLADVIDRVIDPRLGLSTQNA
jgi:ABC-type dipeptide/oligopeptide/nickel transport system permease component